MPNDNSSPKVFTPTKKLVLSSDEEPIDLEYVLMTVHVIGNLYIIAMHKGVKVLDTFPKENFDHHHLMQNQSKFF